MNTWVQWSNHNHGNAMGDLKYGRAPRFKLVILTISYALPGSPNGGMGSLKSC